AWIRSWCPAADGEVRNAARLVHTPGDPGRRPRARTLTPREIADFLGAAEQMGPAVGAVGHLLTDMGPRGCEMVRLWWRDWLPGNWPYPVLRTSGRGELAPADRPLAAACIGPVEEYRDWLAWVAPRLPVGPRARMLMLPARPHSTPTPLTSRRLQRLVDRIAAEAGLEDIEPHDLRAGWIRHGLSVYSLAEVSGAIGHQTLSATTRYAPSGTVKSSPYAPRVRAEAATVADGVVMLRRLETAGEPPTELEALRAENIHLRAALGLAPGAPLPADWRRAPYGGDDAPRPSLPVSAPGAA
ncbi:site-specific integrase, partial [Streptomyces albireticuli]